MKNEDVIKLNFKAWPLPDDYLIELGRVSALWGAVETLMNLCIGKLSDINMYDPKLFILTAHMTFPQRLDILSTLCEQLEPEFPNLQGYKDVVGSLRSAQKLRNQMMHNSFAPDPITSEIRMVIASARGTLKTETRKVEVADIRRATMAIHEALLVK